MKELTISQLIGERIEEFRYLYEAQNEYGLQEFQSYLKLSNGVIIDFPIYDQEVLLKLTEENTQYLLDCFNKGNELSKSVKAKIEGQRIEDLYFSYNQDGTSSNKPAYLKLSNDLYISEINFGPPGVMVDLLMLKKEEFQKRTEELGETIKSYIEEIKNR